MAYLKPTRVPRPNHRPILVVNPVFQNWCQDDGKRTKGAIVPSPGYENFGAANRVRDVDNWSVSEDQTNASSVNLKSAEVLSTSRVVVILLILVSLVSLSSLVLTVMLIFGKIGDQCGCSELQAGTAAQTAETEDSAILARMKSLEGNMTSLQQQLMMKLGQLENIENSLKLLETRNKNLTATLQQISLTVAGFHLLTRQTEEKVDILRNTTTGALTKLNDTTARLHKEDSKLEKLLGDINITLSLKLNDTAVRLTEEDNKLNKLLDVINTTLSIKLNYTDEKCLEQEDKLNSVLTDVNTTLSFKINQISLSTDSVYTLANQTESAFKSFKNSTDDSFASILMHLASLEESANSTKDELSLSISNTNEQVKNATEKLDQEDVALRAVLDELNRTLSIKVENVSKLQGPIGPPGFNGSEGPIGPAGPPGFNGTQGSQGVIGPQGFNGSQGAQGPQGPQGPQGAGDFSLCEHKTDSSSASQWPVTSNTRDSPVKVTLGEPSGKRIVGVTCSSDIAQQYLLRTDINPANSQLFYHCECYGHYDNAESKSVECRMHYWECPLTV